MDDGLGGDFVSLTGFSPLSMIQHFTVTDYIVKGRDHRFRYRVQNAVGWGEFSEESYVIVPESVSNIFSIGEVIGAIIVRNMNDARYDVTWLR
jgi:hypothetical protein